MPLYLSKENKDPKCKDQEKEYKGCEQFDKGSSVLGLGLWYHNYFYPKPMYWVGFLDPLGEGSTRGQAVRI